VPPPKAIAEGQMLLVSTVADGRARRKTLQRAMFKKTGSSLRASTENALRARPNPSRRLLRAMGPRIYLNGTEIDSSYSSALGREATRPKRCSSKNRQRQNHEESVVARWSSRRSRRRSHVRSRKLLPARVAASISPSRSSDFQQEWAARPPLSLSFRPTT